MNKLINKIDRIYDFKIFFFSWKEMDIFAAHGEGLLIRDVSDLSDFLWTVVYGKIIVRPTESVGIQGLSKSRR